MKTFIVSDNFGVAVINAKDEEEVIKLLKNYEGAYPFLSRNLKPSQVRELPKHMGVIEYYPK